MKAAGMKKVMKAMKGMKAMKKAMKAMKKKKAMKVSKIAKGKYSKSAVLRGKKEKTTGGLNKGDLMKNKKGKVISKKAHAKGKKAFQHIKAWTVAVQKARKELGCKGFVAIKKGSALYKRAKEIHSA